MRKYLESGSCTGPLKKSPGSSTKTVSQDTENFDSPYNILVSGSLTNEEAPSKDDTKNCDSPNNILVLGSLTAEEAPSKDDTENCDSPNNVLVSGSLTAEVVPSKDDSNGNHAKLDSMVPMAYPCSTEDKTIHNLPTNIPVINNNNNSVEVKNNFARKKYYLPSVWYRHRTLGRCDVCSTREGPGHRRHSVRGISPSCICHGSSTTGRMYI